MSNASIDIGAVFEEVYRKLLYGGIGINLGGELPLYVQPIPVKLQAEAEEHIAALSKRLAKKGKKTVAINLYDLCMEILQEEGVLDAILNDEASIPREDIVSTLDSVLDIREVIIPRIQATMAETGPDFTFISGVGNVYPFLRSHAILNNLEELASNNSIILFFPGEYNNLQLSLFGRISDENYYRGLNLADVQIIDTRI